MVWEAAIGSDCILARRYFVARKVSRTLWRAHPPLRRNSANESMRPTMPCLQAMVVILRWGDSGTSLGDLEELVLSCRNEDGRGHIAEAVACYKAGAFRACIVSAWIAVVYDLLAKIRELALSGDQAAQVIVDDLSKWQPGISSGDMSAIKSSLDLECTIVNVANDQFGFFEGMQLIDLERLHADRNRCAHPTYQGIEQPYAPSAELARTHLVHAVRHVLSQAPVQGKAAAAQIIRIVELSFFPTDVDKAKVQFKSAGLDRARESLIRAIVDQLVFGYLEGMPPLKGRPQTACAVRAIAEMYPEICEPRIRRALNSICRRVADTKLVFFIGLQKSYSQMWSLLEAGQSDAVERSRASMHRRHCAARYPNLRGNLGAARCLP